MADEATPEHCPACGGHADECDLLAWGDTSPGGDYGPQGYVPVGGFRCDCHVRNCHVCHGTGVISREDNP